MYKFKALVVPPPSKPEVLYTSMDFDPALQILVTGTASPCKDNGTYVLFHPSVDFIGWSNKRGSCLASTMVQDSSNLYGVSCSLDSPMYKELNIVG